MWAIICSGLIAGGAYIAIALGVVLSHRFAHVLNFAQGAIATLCAYLAWQVVHTGISIWVAGLVAILSGTVISLAMGVVITRYLADASELITGLVTLGPTLAIIGIVGAVWGPVPKGIDAPELLAGSVSILGARVGRFDLVFLVVILLIVGALAFLLQRTRAGLALRAVSDDPATAAVNGINVATIERLVWGFTGALAGLAGVGISISKHLDPHYLTSFLIVAFTAVVLGGMGSLGGLVVGSLVYGVIVSLVSYYIGGQWIAVTSLVILSLVYLLRPHGLLGRKKVTVATKLPTQPGKMARSRWIGAIVAQSSRRSRLLPGGRRGRLIAASVAGVGVLVVVILVPQIVGGTTVFVLAGMMAMIIAVAGQNVASGLAERFSLAQGGFMLVGGYSAALLISRAGWPPLLTLLTAIPIGLLLGAALGASVTRLSGTYLAIVTLQFTLAMPELARNLPALTGGETGASLPPLQIGDLMLVAPTPMWYASFAIAVICLTLLAWFGRARVGQRIRAIRDSPLGAESIGMSALRLRILAMAVCGAAGTIAGVLSAMQVGIVTPDSFGLWTSVYLLLGAAIAGRDSLVVGPIVGGAFIVLLPFALNTTGGMAELIFGLAATVVLILRQVLAQARMLAASGDAAPGVLDAPEDRLVRA